MAVVETTCDGVSWEIVGRPAGVATRPPTKERFERLARAIRRASPRVR